MIKVAILDRREIWSSGAASLVRDCGFQLAGTWSDPMKAMPQLVSDPPDILILSASLVHQGHSGIAQLEQRPAIVLVIEPGESLSSRELADFPFEGALVRDTPAAAVRACLKSVAAGHAWLDPSLLRAIEEKGADRPDWKCLSSRELQIANLAAHGLSNKGIAKTLNLADGTVKMHMHHILAKLHVGSRSDLVVLPLASGQDLN